ncbi:MAG: phosphoribosylamine--glycine ligase [Acidimicrobiales bacterium]
MRVCVVGSGGREHALALALARHAEVVVTPGNPGIGGDPAGRITTSSAPAARIDADLYVVGPEQPLVDGLAGELRAAGRRVVGPGADGARLEGSKGFMKEVLEAADLPTARYGAFTDLDAARRFLRTLPGPWVVKTDGLAAGKGVLVATSLEEAEADVAAKLDGAFGDAGRRVVVEEGLAGPECSLLVLCDGRTAVPLVPAQDAKRIGDGDTGPNTGGMGAYAPMSGLFDGSDLGGTDAVAAGDTGDVVDLVRRTVDPLVAELARRGIDYRGVLYAGLMLTDEGPKVLEFNVRFGDPETQAILPLLDEDLPALLGAVADGNLAAYMGGRRTLASRGGSAVCVVLASRGYPTAPVLGDVITGLDPTGQLASPVDGAVVHHAGTRRESPDGPFLTAGGRVLGVTAVAPDLGEARRRAYEAVSGIEWPGMQHRTDIAAHALRARADR